jgi:hypothetical protein
LWILLGLVVIAMVVVVAGFFFGRRQIGEFSARKLGERLSEKGVFISWKSADWVPGIGVHLRGLAVYRDAARHDRLALIDLVTARRAVVSLGEDELQGDGYAAPARHGSG